MMWSQSTKGGPEPAVRVPSSVSWTEDTITLASGGSPVGGLIISRRCERCHGTEGFSGRPTTPNLAGFDRLSFWKELQDFRSGKRESAVMQQILQFVPAQRDPDLAAYYSMLPTTEDPQDVRVFPSEAPQPAHATMAARLISLGDGRRGIPPCQSCHGPVAFVRGAPPLRNQNAGYMLEELQAFADGSRANDINLPMRSIAAAMTDDERHALAEYYGAGFGQGPAGTTAARP
jgi:cytochrome c553